MTAATFRNFALVLALGLSLSHVASASCTVAINPRNGQPVTVCPSDNRQPGSGGTCGYQLDVTTGQLVYVCT